MAKTKTTRVQDARIEIRCQADQKSELEEAAQLEGRALSNWMVWVGLREAKKVKRRAIRE